MGAQALKIPFGKPFPAIDAISLRNGVASGLVNGYINELDDYAMVPGLTAFVTHADVKTIPSLYETLNGEFLGVTNGKVFIVDSGGSVTNFTGDPITSGYCYWAEDGQNVYLAHGGKLARLDITNHIVTLLNENTPNAATHIVRSKGFLLCNGNDVIIQSTPFETATVFGNSFSLEGLAVLTDQPGWILAVASRSVSPDSVGRIYLSKDNGITWTSVYSITANVSASCIEYMGSGVVLVGTGTTTGRILRSTDYGVTWTDIGQLGSQTSITVIKKIAANTVIAGGSAGGGASTAILFRSTNNGSTWAALSTPANFGKLIDSAEIMTSTGTTVVLGALSNANTSILWRSTDSGATFTSIQTISPSLKITAIQRISDTVAVLGVATGGVIYRSINAGATWTQIGAIENFSDDLSISAFCLTSLGELVLATGGGTLNLGGAQIWKSNDDGVSWVLVTVLATDTASGVSFGGLKESHTSGAIIAGGLVEFVTTSGVGTAAKWQMGVGRNAPQGDVFFSEMVSDGYELVDSWERFNAQSVPDSVTGVFENRGLVYTAGPRSIEINYCDGAADLPWKVSDPALPYGLGAPFSWVNYDDTSTVMYLSCTDKIWEVVKFQGRVQQSISQEYSAILNDRTLITSPETAKAWGIIMRGIPMYVLTFQDDDLTICYNLVKNHWFRWAYWNGTTYEAALINSYCYSKATKKHFVGDRRDTGKIFELTGTAEDSGDMRFELTSGWIGDGTPTPVGRMIFTAKRGAVTDSTEPTFSWARRDNGNQNFPTARTVSLGLTNDTEMFGALNRCGQYQKGMHRIVYLGQKTEFIFAGADES